MFPQLKDKVDICLFIVCRKSKHRYKKLWEYNLQYRSILSLKVQK